MGIQIDTKVIFQQMGKIAFCGKDGTLALLIKQLTEATLQAEIEYHLSKDLAKNRKLVPIFIDLLNLDKGLITLCLLQIALNATLHKQRIIYHLKLK
jgi:hypothetical protein